MNVPCSPHPTRTLWQVLAQVPDPRQASGQRYALESLLALTTIALLCGSRSLYAIAQFGRDHRLTVGPALGFDPDKMPCVATLFLLFQDLNVAAFEAALTRWLEGRRKGAHWRALSLDGKTLRGSQGHLVPGVHLVAAYAHEAQAVLGQQALSSKGGELQAALQLLDILPVAGRLVQGDAAFCQRTLSRKIVKKKGITSGR
jgi:hypothetical protein